MLNNYKKKRAYNYLSFLQLMKEFIKIIFVIFDKIIKSNSVKIKKLFYFSKQINYKNL